MTNKRLLLTLAVLLVCNGVQAALTAPDSVEAGSLAVCKSDTTATWAIYPQSYRGSYYVADGGCTCVIASPVKGVITVMAASVNDAGGVDISEHTLYNGEPTPDADKTDPAPDVEPEPETIDSVIDADSSQATVAELNALSNAFATVIQSIDNGAIKTPAGARETFRAVWLRQAALTSPEAIDKLSGLVDKLSAMVDNSDLQAMRRDYAAIVAALRKRSGCDSGRCTNGR